jgi:hypothetical protein
MQGTKEAFRPDFDLTHPKDWPTWLQNMHTENGVVEITKDGIVIWWGGTIHDGIWMGGYWMGGVWRDGIWLDGIWHDGRWCYGEWRGGHFLKGLWQDGVFRAGKFEGTWYGGLWLGGEFNGFWQRSRQAPPVMTVELPIVGRHRIIRPKEPEGRRRKRKV